MIDVVNLQRKVKVESDIFRAFSKLLASIITEAAGRAFSVAFITDDRMKQLNELFRDKDSTTDVLSFPSGPSAAPNPQSDRQLGDIAIALGVARRQAARHGHSLGMELRILALHGLLHLLGYDHETDHGEMRALEDRLRRRWGLSAGVVARAAGSRTSR